MVFRLHERWQELYRDDPERADALVFGRRSMKLGRRGFLNGAGLAAMTAAVGAPIVFADRMPAGLVPAAFAQTPGGTPPGVLRMPGKEELILRRDRPLAAETPAILLDDPVTPTECLYISNNGEVPPTPATPEAWKLRIDGEVNTPLDLTVGELASRFGRHTLQLQLESGGNGRSFFAPLVPGVQWGHGAISSAEWTGVRLGDVLRAAGVKPSAVYTGHYGADGPVLSRGIPIAKAMEDNTLLATHVNGEPIPLVHGGPLRLIASGYPGSCSHKWLTRIAVRDRVHDGAGMESYRVTEIPIAPGSVTPASNLKILESMPIRSIITNVPNGVKLPDGVRNLVVRGHAWAGERLVRQVTVSVDFGVSWHRTDIDPPPNRFAWQNWRTVAELPSAGYFEIWVRATDQDGHMQPHVVGDWNPGGFGGNTFHRVAVTVDA